MPPAPVSLGRTPALCWQARSRALWCSQAERSSPGATLAARLGRGAVTGAAQGAVGGFGRAEGELGQQAEQAATGAALGAPLGGAGAAIAPAIARGAQRLIRGKQDETAVQGLFNTVLRDDDIGAAGQRAVAGVQDAYAKGKAGVNAAYEKVAKLEGEIEDAGAFELLSNKITRLVDESDIKFSPNGPNTVAFAEDVVARFQNKATPQTMEKTRQRINKFVSSADKREKPFLLSLKGEFDDWMVDTLKNRLYRGDEEAVK